MGDNLIGSRLKELRKIHNYTQDYVAEVLNKTRQTYSHYETGRLKPSPETLYKLSGLYNISVDDLLHLSLKLDKDKSFDAPAPSQSSDDLASYLAYFNDPRIQKKYLHHTNLEKELLYYFQSISEEDKKELIEIAKIKSRKNRQKQIYSH